MKKLVKESLYDDGIPSRGKTQQILDFVEAAGPEGVKYTDIIRLAYEIDHGEGSYSHENRGYWSGAFKTPTPDDGEFGHLIKYLTKNDKGRWILRDSKMSREESENISRNVTYDSPHWNVPGTRKVGSHGKFNIT